MQVLQSDDYRNFWLFQNWGRTGTNVRGNKLEKYSTAQEAVDEFERIFREKTGNIFDPTVQVKKKPGLYFPIEIDYEDDGSKKLDCKQHQITSKLPLATQKLMRIIFDVNNMIRTMKEFELDLTRMPLGKISKNTLLEAQATLSKINELIEESAEPSKFFSLSNKFYTLVPHNVGMKKLPEINTVDLINEKQDMIDSLQQIEIAYSLMQGDDDENVNSVDKCYNQLETSLELLDHGSEEFTIIKTQLENTHGPTHEDFSLTIDDAFKVERNGEKERFRPFRDLSNRLRLWHGSRITNFASILKNGLKIAPPEAPPSGYMFGKGNSNS